MKATFLEASGDCISLLFRSKPSRQSGGVSPPLFQDGVVLGADTRATDDMVVADKNCMKIHYIAPKI